MAKPLHASLTRRERQIMDILYRRGRATAGEVLEGLRYVYMPAVPRHAARKPALRHLVETFFDGSAEKAVAALLGGDGRRLSEDELNRIAELVARARKEGSQ